MWSGCCQFWFEKQPEGRSPRRETSVDVCAHGAIVVTETLVCARQRPPQFPLHPYTPRLREHEEEFPLCCLTMRLTGERAEPASPVQPRVRFRA
jgi:hypothetical protein